MTKICLELKNITKSFTKEDAVLNGINLTIHKGEFITLLGSSGCGKTTTLRIVAGLEMPDSGQVFLDGRRCYIAGTGSKRCKYCFSELRSVSSYECC